MLSLVRIARIRNFRLNVVFPKVSLKLVGLFIVCAVVVYCEIFSFSVCCWQWPKLSSASDEDELRVLFVADPQLVGLRDEPRLLGAVTRWDCDKYLQFGFFHAVAHVRPHVVVFLGDLLDEGSIASDDEFVTYIRRFRRVFRMPTTVRSVFASGDNDVGGEGSDSKLPWKLDRFAKHFQDYGARGNSSMGVASVKHVSFQKISFDFGERISQSHVDALSDVRAHSTARYRIVCNHMPLLSRLPLEISRIIEILQPHLIVTAHTHLFELYRCKDCRPHESSQNADKIQSAWKGEAVSFNDLPRPMSVNLSDVLLLHELVIPTCSYRMGVPNMGYGAAVISRSGQMKFDILWLPSRYRQLKLYVIILSLIAVWLLMARLYRYAKIGYNMLIDMN